jgi:HPt (histidine-containing phosphotransfer) domain-containing protein
LLELEHNLFDVNDKLVPMNTANFLRMAHGDLRGLRELAFDFFNDTRRQMTGWLALIESKNYKQLRDDLHRCKGGASLFGLERIVAFIGSCESPAMLEEKGFDLTTFEDELTAAESAVLALTE